MLGNQEGKIKQCLSQEENNDLIKNKTSEERSQSPQAKYMNKNCSYINDLTNISTNSTISIINNSVNKARKKIEEAFQNYFKNPKYKLDLDKTKLKIFPNNDFFVGILDQDEKFPLKGILVSNYGEYYDGEFVNGKREGEGKLIYANGNQYEGTFLSGLPNGKGKLIQTDNDIYE